MKVKSILFWRRQMAIPFCGRLVIGLLLILPLSVFAREPKPAQPIHVYVPSKIEGVYWLAPQIVQSKGVTLGLFPFTSSLPAAAAARALAENTLKFQRLQVFPGLVVLSGFHQHMHWLAYIQQSPQGTQGYVSHSATNEGKK